MHFMIDTETLGTKPGSVITQIACVVFNPYALVPEEKSFSTFMQQLKTEVCLPQQFDGCINPVSCLKHGLTIDHATLEWRVANDIPWQRGGFDLTTMLMRFSDFIGKNITSSDDLHFWMKGPSFDAVLLEAAYRAVDLSPPWKFWQLRDVRTICDAARISRTDAKTLPEVWDGLSAHDALDDCTAQARMVALSYFKLGITTAAAAQQNASEQEA